MNCTGCKWPSSETCRACRAEEAEREQKKGGNPYASGYRTEAAGYLSQMRPASQTGHAAVS